MEEKNYKKALKSNIILFLSYSSLISFIFVLITFIVKSALHDISNPFLSTTLSLISGILIFNLLQFICRSSSFETFKKTTLDEENSTNFIKKMNLFFIICIMCTIVICIGYLLVDSLIYSNAIAKAYTQYSSISKEFTDSVINIIHKEYQDSLLGKTISTIIIELSLIISFISLVPYQKKLVSKFNKKTD